MKLAEFDYALPEELIAQYPLADRTQARLLVLERASRSFRDRTFSDIVEYLKPGDALVLNDTKVVPARIFGKRGTGGKVEFFLLNSVNSNNGTCEALVRSSRRLKDGERIVLESDDTVHVLAGGQVGRRLRFDKPIEHVLQKCGHVPLPPYIKRDDEPSDRHDYQTVYSRQPGATASPTAGLHFTVPLLNAIREQGVHLAYVTLHTSYGTFAPIKTGSVEEHHMHREYFRISAETMTLIRDVKRAGKKVFAVGTTTTRVLEHCADAILMRDERKGKMENGRWKGEQGHTDLYIYPPYDVKIVDCLITNFHLPKSTLLLLVSAFAGRDFILKAYQHAIEQKYRFFSYGDAMLIVEGVSGQGAKWPSDSVHLTT